jgi:hypothetical protein
MSSRSLRRARAFDDRVSVTRIFILLFGTVKIDLPCF